MRKRIRLLPFLSIIAWPFLIATIILISLVNVTGENGKTHMLVDIV